jgi:type IV pilus assembly protein PilQ
LFPRFFHRRPSGAILAGAFLLGLFGCGCATDSGPKDGPTTPPREERGNADPSGGFAPPSGPSLDEASPLPQLPPESAAPPHPQETEGGGAPNAAEAPPPDSSPSGPPSPSVSEESAAATRLPDEPISLDMRNVDIGLLLRTLARIAGQNLVLSENVRGMASLAIEKQSWRDVFLSLLRTYGLTYAWEGDIIRVMTAEDIAKDFQLLELEQRRRAKKREIENVAPLETEVFAIRYGDVENLGEIFAALLQENAEPRRRGAVMVDAFTNSLVVQANRRDLERVDRLLAALDRPTSQIRIEARIVEASSDTARELGIEWGGYYRAGNEDRNFWVAPGVNSFTGAAEDGNAAGAAIRPPAGLIQQLPGILSEIRDGSGLNIGFVGERIGDYVLGVQLSALEKAGKLRILSSPSISTLDNQTATIESGREVPFQTVDEGEVNVEFKEAVLRLEVTPHLIGPETLKLRILTNKDELDFSNTVDGNPTVITKRARTSVLLRDGQTTVIGGLRKETLSDSERGVPYLMDIPLLGHLFRRDSKSENMEEILIFITPRVLRDIDAGRKAPQPRRLGASTD